MMTFDISFIVYVSVSNGVLWPNNISTILPFRRNINKYVGRYVRESVGFVTEF